MTYQNTEHAFNAAIACGRLSSDPLAPNYAGLYMYMGTNEDDLDLFKHIETREYLPACNYEN
jgi:hypothetical protein